MVYVVERYLPGLPRSDLLRGLSRLEPANAADGHGAGSVRYLGSTIVLRDEACFCQFEGPSADAVAEVNRQAGLPFDRIVPAVTVNPKGAEMSTFPSIPATVEIKRGRLFGLVVGDRRAGRSRHLGASPRSRSTAAARHGCGEAQAVAGLHPDFGPRLATATAQCPGYRHGPHGADAWVRRSCR